MSRACAAAGRIRRTEAAGRTAAGRGTPENVADRRVQRVPVVDCRGLLP
jgi:hypothetical protein